MKKYLISLVFLFLSLNSYAHPNQYFSRLLNPDSVSMKLGGWSNHTGKNGDLYDYNENHKGFGFEASWAWKKSSSGTRAGFWLMNDSNNNRQTSVGIGLYKRWQFKKTLMEAIDLNISLDYIRHTDRVKNFYTKKTVSIEQMSGFIIYPYMTYHFTKNIHADFMYLPKKLSGLTVNVFFWRLGYRF